ncbi:MAG: hypothetical protein GC193_14095 [Cryomorphaceae bacterium]|nr:hypothetical protein [Cryomorphaceae bacterium]
MKTLNLPDVLLAPERPWKVGEKAKWLAGEGAGSWFVVNQISIRNFEITRFDPQGEIECKGLFYSTDLLDLHDEWMITYPSHCAFVSLVIQDDVFTLKRIL